MDGIRKIEYVVADPSKNITILVESEVDKCDYALIAKKLLQIEPLAEQVGFLQFDNENDIILNMAGDEFCGNATMSAAVYYGIKKNMTCGNVVVKSSGVDHTINVEIKKVANTDEWEGIVEMPRPIKMQEIDFGDGEKFPVVFFEGIAHVIIDRIVISRKDDGEKKLFDNHKIIDDCDNKILISDSLKNEFEKRVKVWSEFLKVSAIGIMFCDNIDDIKRSQDLSISEVQMMPLVYVKSIDSLYWESSCASGTTAVGVYLADKNKRMIDINVKQPSGANLNIKNCEDGKFMLKGKVALICEKTVKL